MLRSQAMLITPEELLWLKRGGGVRKAQVDPDVASSSELILALVDDLITAVVIV